ncbi:MAG: U32 family peptidase [Treponema sp.]|jgi:collagenase-like PrtC family protease|nr:U32 family peptidase [Treponema sp.]
MKPETIPELLVAAGSAETLDAAVAEGADSVSMSLKSFNAGIKNTNSAYSRLEGALRSLRRQGRKLYVELNTVFEQREADRQYQLLKYLAGIGPDGILVQDFGAALMAKEYFPSLKLFASAMMNTASARGANLLSRFGFSRAVLPRELSLDEVRDIRGQTNMELELPVHKPLCMSVSGLCLFSSYLGGKSANRDMCTEACRRYYQIPSAAQGGYFFNAGDLQLIKEIPSLAGAGVNSFRIECRMKNAVYTGIAVSAYRLVLDSLGSGREEPAVKEALVNLAGGSIHKSKRYPRVIPGDLSAFKRVPGREKAPLPEEALWFRQGGSQIPVSSANTGGRSSRRGKKTEEDFPPGLYAQVSRPEDLYSIQSIRPAKVMLNYRRRFLSRLLGIQKQPLPFTPQDIILVLDPFFPQSLEKELSEDIQALAGRGYCSYVVNNHGHFALFKDSKAGIISGPWLYAFNQWALAFISKAYGNASRKGTGYFISPLENNRQNLEKTLPLEYRPLAFITVYSRPSLFRIRADLGAFCDFREFTDSLNEGFYLSTSPEGSYAYPEKPFYIGDKVPFLQKAGFRRFILDLSADPVKKQDYKALVDVVNAAQAVKGAGRFNWKNGFFTPKE